MPPVHIPWLRVALWTVGTAIIVTLLWLPRDIFRRPAAPAATASASSAAEAPTPRISLPRLRVAAADEWAQPIAELGRRSCAKQLVWHGLTGPSKDCHGQLAWWHDGNSERLAYLPAAGEGMRQALDVIASIRDGRAALYEFHGDSGLRERLGDLGNSIGLPEGFALLSPPRPSASASAP